MTRDSAALGSAPSGSAVPARTLGGAPAPLLRRIVLQGKYETITMLRNGEQLILAVVLPLLAMVGLTVMPLLDGFAETVSPASPAPTTTITGFLMATVLPQEPDGGQGLCGCSPVGSSGIALGP